MRISLYIISLLVCTVAHAQQVKTYHDAFGIQGQVRYTGQYLPDSLPQRGPVDIRWRTIDSTHLKTYIGKGNTLHHTPHGAWTWEEATWQYQIRVGDNSQPVFNTTGRRKRWEGRFLRGIPDGRWSFSLDSINSAGKVAANFIRITIQYKEGIPTGTITYENRLESGGLLGTLNNKGIAIGTWVYKYKNNEGLPVTEERSYNDGLLTSINITTGKNKYTINLEHNAAYLTANTAQDKNRIGSLQFATEEYDTDGSDAFFRDFSEYFLTGWQLQPFTHAFHRKGPGFQRLEFPLTEEEKADIGFAKTLITQQKKEIENHLADNIHIYRFRSAHLDTTVGYLQLKLERLHLLDSLLSRTDQPEFSYKNRAEQGMQNWMEELNQKHIVYGEVFDNVKVDVGLLPTSTINIFKQIRDYLTSNQNSLPGYFSTVENAGIALHREGELKTLEDEMINRFDKLQATYADKKGIGQIIYERFIKGEVTVLLQDFAGTEDYTSAINKSTSITARLDSLELWENQLETFDKMQETIRAEYTTMVYNPYSGANDIEIVRKRKFIQNVLTQLWPYMQQEIGATTDWSVFADRWNQQFAMYDYLLAFAQRDDAQAKKVDRRVRRDKKPEKMLQHLLEGMKENG